MRWYAAPNTGSIQQDESLYRVHATCHSIHYHLFLLFTGLCAQLTAVRFKPTYHSNVPCRGCSLIQVKNEQVRDWCKQKIIGNNYNNWKGITDEEKRSLGVLRAGLRFHTQGVQWSKGRCKAESGRDQRTQVLVSKAVRSGDGRRIDARKENRCSVAGALCKQMTWGMVFWMECGMERKLLHSPQNQLFFF